MVCWFSEWGMMNEEYDRMIEWMHEDPMDQWKTKRKLRGDAG